MIHVPNYMQCRQHLANLVWRLWLHLQRVTNLLRIATQLSNDHNDGGAKQATTQLDYTIQIHFETKACQFVVAYAYKKSNHGTRPRKIYTRLQCTALPLKDSSNKPFFQPMQIKKNRTNGFKGDY